MTQIKLCGMLTPCDIDYANALRPDYIGFILAPGLRRSRSREEIQAMRAKLLPEIRAVGVYINEPIEQVATDVSNGLIDVVQLHGTEDNAYIAALRKKVSCKIIKAFQVKGPEDVARANESSADLVLLDSGQGTGKTFDHSVLEGITREYFLAGGLNAENVSAAIEAFSPLGVDTSSALETEGAKDPEKMAAFCEAVRETDARMCITEVR